MVYLPPVRLNQSAYFPLHLGSWHSHNAPPLSTASPALDNSHVPALVSRLYGMMSISSLLPIDSKSPVNAPIVAPSPAAWIHLGADSQLLRGAVAGKAGRMALATYAHTVGTRHVSHASQLDASGAASNTPKHSINFLDSRIQELWQLGLVTPSPAVTPV